MRAIRQQKRAHIPAVNIKTRIDYTPLTGGLDILHSALSILNGRMLYGFNFEEKFGQQGYHRINGYERYDGQPQPHQAVYYILYFDQSTAEIAAGDHVTGAAAMADVVSATLLSGTWVSNGAGFLVLTNVSGSFVHGENILVSSVSRAKASGTNELGTMGDENYAVNYLGAVTYTRNQITIVPGSGPILGIGVYRGVVYAVRNSADGQTAAIYSGSSSGWTLLKGGLIPGGAWKFDVSNFTGSAKTLTLFGCDGKNDPVAYDGTTVSRIRGVWDTVATSTSTVTIGTGLNAFVLTEADRDYAVDEEITVWDDTNAANFMAGKVLTWTSATKTLSVTVTTTGGSGTISTWTVGRTDFKDKPTSLLNFKDHLFLTFPLGQLKTSDLGDPFLFTTTAALFGMGYEITGLLPLKGDVLAVFGVSNISLLSGTSQIDWVMDVLSTTSGSMGNTAIEVAGIGIIANMSGIRSLQAMQAYDGYEASTFSRDISRVYASVSTKVVGAAPQVENQQYRLYCNDGAVLVGTIITPNAAVTPNDCSFSLLDYDQTISCVAGGLSVSGEGLIFFGTDDGYVMRDGVGTSFDGEVIISALMLPFNHFKSPSNHKRFRKVIVELEALNAVEISFKQIFDYSDGEYPSSINQVMTALGDGGILNISKFNECRFSVPIQAQGEADLSGVGRNMSLLIWNESAVDPSFVLQGVLIHYSINGMVR
jgi:hypothetical protein